VRVQQGVAVEADEACDQPAECGIGRGFDLVVHATELAWQRACSECQLRNHAEAATAALEPPEGIGIGAGIGDADLAVRDDDFGLPPAAVPKFLEKLPKPPLGESGWRGHLIGGGVRTYWQGEPEHRTAGLVRRRP
jgi:hypothetical protein